MLRRRTFVAVALAAFATLAHAEVRDGGQGQGLAVDRGRAIERRGAETLYAVSVDRASFEAGRALELPGTAAGPQRARFVRSERRGTDFTWVGTVDTEFGEQSVVITIGRDATFGTIPQRRGPPLRIESRHGRTWLVEGRQRRKMQAGSPGDARIPRVLEPRTERVVASATPTPVGPAAVSTVDVLVAYTPSMVTEYGSSSAVLTRLSYLEALTNQAYVDTPADIRIRVVGRELLNYTTASDNDTLLDLITDPSVASVKTQIDGWRSQYGADLVTVVRHFDNATQGNCGVGWIGGYHGSAFSSSWGFSVVSDGTDDGFYCTDSTFAHELGHNMGSHHDTETADGDYGAYPYSRGYRKTIDASTGFATIMAYGEGPQTDLNRFSNPSQATACLGQACGVNNSSDNALGFSNAAASIAAFRATVVPPAPTPTLAAADVATTEGNSGTKSLTFTVTLSAATNVAVSFDVLTEDGTATAGSDYVALGTTRLTIAAGATSRTVAVTINGDTVNEANETFTLRLQNASGAVIADPSAVGTITNDDSALPTLSIADVVVIEGNSGTKTGTFTVLLSKPATQTVTYSIATQNATATAPSDYVASLLTGQTIAVGASSKTFVVTVNGDTTVEANQTFKVNVTGVTGATVKDGVAVGTIRNDDGPTLRINDVSATEADAENTRLTFTVSLSQAAAVPVTYDVAAASSTAISGSDFYPRALVGETIPAGTLSRVFTVWVKPDDVAEATERVAVDLTNATGATIYDARGFGTILDDD